VKENVLRAFSVKRNLPFYRKGRARIPINGREYKFINRRALRSLYRNRREIAKFAREEERSPFGVRDATCFPSLAQASESLLVGGGGRLRLFPEGGGRTESHAEGGPYLSHRLSLELHEEALLHVKRAISLGIEGSPRNSLIIPKGGKIRQLRGRNSSTAGEGPHYH